MIVIDKSLTERVAAEDLWYRIDEVFGDGGGVYSLACLSSPPADTVLPIHRVLGEDKAGVLRIARSNSRKACRPRIFQRVTNAALGTRPLK